MSRADRSFAAGIVRLVLLSAALAVLALVPLAASGDATTGSGTGPPAGRSVDSPTRTAGAKPVSSAYNFARQSKPARTVVTDGFGKWLATFTDGVRTVTVSGPTRDLSEPTATAKVTNQVWVRALDSPFGGRVDEAWLSRALQDRSPDLIALGMQYIEGASNVSNDDLRIAGDAYYGPLLPDGTRREGSDFNDFLGTSATYGSAVDEPESDQAGSLDCSGYIRMIWGYRSGLPMSLRPDGYALPRRAFEMYDSAPGLVTTENSGSQVTSFSRLAPGDLVFFDASTDDGEALDHVGMYLGRDTAGDQRFISSRKSVNGPTLGDYRGKSVLNGSGLYAKAFRAARRL